MGLSGEHDVHPEAWRPIAAKGRETEHVACPVGTRGRHKGAERETRETAREGEDSCPLETQRCVGERDRNTKWNDESTPRHTRVRTCRVRRIDGVEGTVRRRSDETKRVAEDARHTHPRTPEKTSCREQESSNVPCRESSRWRKTERNRADWNDELTIEDDGITCRFQTERQRKSHRENPGRTETSELAIHPKGKKVNRNTCAKARR